MSAVPGLIRSQERTQELTSTACAPVVFSVFQTGASANGGVESITAVIERCTRIRPVVVTQIDTPVNNRWRESGVEVNVWPIPYRMGSPLPRTSPLAIAARLWSIVQTNLRMAQLVRRTGAGVVHCNDISAFVHSALGARCAGANVVQNVRDTKAPGVAWGARWRLAYRLSRWTIVLSGEMRDALLKAVRPRSGNERVKVIYSAVNFHRMAVPNAAERRAERARLGIDPNCFVVAYVAGFNAKKAQLEFIRRAAPLIAERMPESLLCFVGDFEPGRDPYARACRDAAVEMRLKKLIRFCGYTTEVSAWYRAADVVVLASRQEGLARCMIEAIACGTPVVSFDVCSAREILEGYHCGRVVAQGDYSALVGALAMLAENPDVRSEMGRMGATAARHLFDPDETARQYEEIYLGSLACSGPRG